MPSPVTHSCSILEQTLPKPGTKALAPKETLEVRIGKQACAVSYFKA
jgi:hypothetical protein